jgi:CRP-like cAMP-binding protein
MLSQEDVQFYLSVLKGVSAVDIFRLFKAAKTKKILAGEVYIHEQSNFQKMAYIKKGLIRAYQLKGNGDEVTILLRWEGQFVASHDCVFAGKPSRFIFQAMEDTVLTEIDYTEALEVTDRHPVLVEYKINLLKDMLAQSVDRLESFVLLSPKERYLKLLQEKPNIVNRVPDKYLSTYLGITAVSLSRIRKRIVSEQKH